MSIARLMAVEPAERRLGWLFEALQWAIELEFSTIPAYLCGMWSIIDGNSPVRGYLQQSFTKPTREGVAAEAAAAEQSSHALHGDAGL